MVKRSKEDIKKYYAQYYLDNKDKLLEQSRTYHRINKTSKERYKRYRLKSKYNMTLEEYKNRMDSVNYNCEICSYSEADIRDITNTKLHIDHCHESGKVRGVLCKSCNTGLGNLKDSVEVMKKAISYLEQAKKNEGNYIKIK